MIKKRCSQTDAAVYARKFSGQVRIAERLS
jgi:hypothetical protein